MTVRSSLFSAAAAFIVLTCPLGAEDEKPQDKLDLRYENGIVAIVEDRAITVEEVRREIEPLVGELHRNYNNEADYNKALETLQSDIIQNLIDRVLIVKDFRKDEKKQIPRQFVDNDIDEMQNVQFEGDRSKFLAYLRSKGKTSKEHRKEVEDEIIYNYMRHQLRKSTSVVSPVKIETYYNENKDKFYQDDAVDLRLIQINREQLAQEQFKAKTEDVVTRLNAGEKFEDVAKEVSADARKTRGGDWGWQKRGDLRKEFVSQLFTLEKGQFSTPIYLGDSAYILYVNDRKFAGIQPVDQVRDQIEKTLVSQMAREAQERWLERLRRNGYVKYF